MFFSLHCRLLSYDNRVYHWTTRLFWQAHFKTYNLKLKKIPTCTYITRFFRSVEDHKLIFFSGLKLVSTTSSKITECLLHPFVLPPPFIVSGRPMDHFHPIWKKMAWTCYLTLRKSMEEFVTFLKIQDGGHLLYVKKSPNLTPQITFHLNNWQTKTSAYFFNFLIRIT